MHSVAVRVGDPQGLGSSSGAPSRGQAWSRVELAERVQQGLAEARAEGAQVGAPGEPLERREPVVMHMDGHPGESLGGPMGAADQKIRGRWNGGAGLGQHRTTSKRFGLGRCRGGRRGWGWKCFV